MNNLNTLNAATRIALAFGLATFAAPLAQAQINIMTTTTSGIVPGTATTYTITDRGSAARNIFPDGQSDKGTFAWTNGFPEFLTAGGLQLLNVTFSAPVPINKFVFGANSYFPQATIAFTVTGGTATTADFDLQDSLQAFTGPTGAGAYNPATGQLTATSGDQSVIVGSTSSKTITSFDIVARNPEGYTLFFGTVNAAPSAVPEPGSVALLVGMMTVGAGIFRKRRKA